MDEAEARAWLVSTFDVPRETLQRLDAFVALLRTENERQNLVSRSSLDAMWSRHIADSAQLLLHASAAAGSWIDLGTGAGFPGLMAALLHPAAVTMVEERRKRVEFLSAARETLQLPERTRILGSRVEVVEPAKYDVISARAFAPLDRLLALGERFATPQTRWVLPKGRNAKTELAAAEASWQGEFRLEPSLTDADAWIIVAEGVRRRAKGKSKR
ncbi:MAG TPA: 16S rRNA (guanine(527)-N(7))-methyltransferase RsmG [Allosphingosinicella sp.]